MDGRGLRRRRQALKLTRRALADAVGVKKNAVDRWEGGFRPVPATVDLFFAKVKIERQKALIKTLYGRLAEITTRMKEQEAAFLAADPIKVERTAKPRDSDAPWRWARRRSRPPAE